MAHVARPARLLFAVLASALFLGLAAFEVVHDVVRWTLWPGYAWYANYVVLLLAPVWLLAAASVWIPREWGWLGVLGGAVACITHGAVTRIGGSDLGTLFIATAPVVVLLAWLARPRLAPALPARAPTQEEAPARPGAPPVAVAARR
jgi:hypothetical protein